MITALEIIFVITTFIAGFIFGGVACGSKEKPEGKKEKPTDHKRPISYAVVDKDTKELVAYIGGKDVIKKRDIDIINFGYNEPTFLGKDGKVYVDELHFTITSL